MEDTKIVDLFWNRDEAALEKASSKYTLFCFHIAWNILMNREDSEECVNDTWFAAWRYIPPKKPAILSIFLGKITRGFAIDKLRKKYASKRTDMHMTSLNILEETQMLNQALESPLEDHIQEQELLQIINEFLYHLKEKDQDIFIRRYWYMDSIEEIAKRHHNSVSSIKSNLFRTRKKLRKKLMEERYLP